MLIGHLLGNDKGERAISQGKPGCCNQRRKWSLSPGVWQLVLRKNLPRICRKDHSPRLTKPRSMCFRLPGNCFGVDLALQEQTLLVRSSFHGLKPEAPISFRCFKYPPFEMKAKA